MQFQLQHDIQNKCFSFSWNKNPGVFVLVSIKNHVILVDNIEFPLLRIRDINLSIIVKSCEGYTNKLPKPVRDKYLHSQLTKVCAKFLTEAIRVLHTYADTTILEYHKKTFGLIGPSYTVNDVLSYINCEKKFDNFNSCRVARLTFIKKNLQHRRWWKYYNLDKNAFLTIKKLNLRPHYLEELSSIKRLPGPVDSRHKLELILRYRGLENIIYRTSNYRCKKACKFLGIKLKSIFAFPTNTYVSFENYDDKIDFLELAQKYLSGKKDEYKYPAGCTKLEKRTFMKNKKFRFLDTIDKITYIAKDLNIQYEYDEKYDYYVYDEKYLVYTGRGCWIFRLGDVPPKYLAIFRNTHCRLLST